MPVSRVYWGHAFQLDDWGAFEPANANGTEGDAIDADPNFEIFPWTDDNVAPYATLFKPVGGNGNATDIFSSSSAGPARPIRQPEARKWILARQNAILANDDQTAPNANSKTVYLGSLQTARSVFLNDPAAGLCPQLRDGRVDAAATTLRDIRDRLIALTDGEPIDEIRPEQRRVILDELLYYPRAETYAPSAHRVDQALGNHIINAGCSAIKIEWTYKPGVAARGVRCNTDFPYRGYTPPVDNNDLERDTVWFGMDELGVDLAPDVRTRPLIVVANDYGTLDLGLETIDPDNIENFYTINVNGQQVQVYEAVFGFNQTQPFADGTGSPSSRGCVPNDVNHDFAYTPWPTALRVTMTLHDAETRLEAGREVQFVLPLPRGGGL